MTTMMEQARDERAAEYNSTLDKIKSPDGSTPMSEHPGAKYLSTGYGHGFIHGYQTSSGAAHAGLSVTIGAIDAGTLDLEQVKAQLIQLRNAIKEAAGL
ncbi:hypothetical protein SEA_DEJAVU_96 [Microbacterium Phage DejaVu]|nr:hypothetical protein LUPINE_95 [Microbacterium phage Lupine]QDH92242.1 hypothetical protein SEA_PHILLYPHILLY_93 [Microbacterium phage PhillyPhilly]QDK03338.1 hypothetical protein SEA_ROMAN_97 [Microbacterium phage Roman]QIG58639.1 hypothetical protein SEA_HUBBS_94 [Microbacterium phage Hubbs]UVG34151.1 hypothetical protein SEA_PAVLO_95 [Microbacterium phage Pavlo]WNM66228.1 hypothetical protein SEA_DEJAVU_96 [Microbacterium Phage DejaVu]